MKRIKKIALRKIKKQANEDQPVSSRITNETVAEHREKILAGGRKFKYPRQYVRHKLVINALLITLVTAIVLALIGWQQLYVTQNTTNFIYRVTRVLPLNVGSVDGEAIRYGDYLMRYRSQEMWLRNRGEIGTNSEGDKRQLNYVKQSVMDGLVADMYAQKLARDTGVVVTDSDVQAIIDSNRHTATGTISQEVYDASTKSTLGYSPDEYRHIIYQSLVRQRVAYKIDDQAKTLRDEVSKTLGKKKHPTLQEIAIQYKKKGVTLEFGASGLVPKNNQDGGLSQTTVGLKDGQISFAVESTTGDGYYFVQRSFGNDSQISYQYLRVPLTVFNDKLTKIKNEQKVHIFITIPTQRQENV